MRLERRWWRRGKELDCAEVGKVLQTYLDGELDRDDWPVIERHLEACRACGLSEATYERIKAALARPLPDDIDPAVLERLRAFGAALGGEDPRQADGV